MGVDKSLGVDTLMGSTASDANEPKYINEKCYRLPNQALPGCHHSGGTARHASIDSPLNAGPVLHLNQGAKKAGVLKCNVLGCGPHSKSSVDLQVRY